MIGGRGSDHAELEVLAWSAASWSAANWSAARWSVGGALVGVGGGRGVALVDGRGSDLAELGGEPSGRGGGRAEREVVALAGGRGGDCAELEEVVALVGGRDGTRTELESSP